MCLNDSLPKGQPNLGALAWKFRLKYSDLNIVRHSQFQPKTNCVFRTFRVEESFWTKKQSCKFSKVGIMKWRPLFDFVRFNGRHFT